MQVPPFSQGLSLHSSMSREKYGHRLAHEQSIISRQSFTDHEIDSQAMKWVPEKDVFLLFFPKGKLLGRIFIDGNLKIMISCC